MRNLISVVLLGSCMLACHRSTEVRGIYVSQAGEGTFFPCEEPNTALLVPDSGLAARYQAEVGAPAALGVYVRLRGIKTRSGSIYSGRRYFVVKQILELRPRARGECAQVAHPISTVLPSGRGCLTRARRCRR